jgi:hypothetical protein
MSELPENQIKRLRSLIQEAEDNLAAARELLNSVLGDGALTAAPIPTDDIDGEKVVEGIFDGQNMIGNNKRVYPVPANYASKSKLVEGDILKLTIAENGKLLYKQISPVDRKTVIGTLVKHDDQYHVEVSGREYRVLYASITYFRIKVGDQVSIVIPADNPEATWAAIESNL